MRYVSHKNSAKLYGGGSAVFKQYIGLSEELNVACELKKNISGLKQAKNGSREHPPNQGEGVIN